MYWVQRSQGVPRAHEQTGGAVTNRKLCLFLSYLSFAVPTAADIPAETARLYYDAYDALLDYTAEKTTINGAIEEFLADIADLEDEEEELYWRAKASYLKGLVESEHGDSDLAVEFFRETVLMAEQLQKTWDVELAYVLEADARAEIMLNRGIPYIIANGWEVQRLAGRVLAINADNPRANLLQALGSINTPRVFGGSPENGIQLLQKFLQPPDGKIVLTSQDHFWYLLALGDAYAKTGALTLSLSAYAKALILYPGNKPVRRMIADLAP
jgi:tetratricopeptide (TPR) repeat protein